MNSEEAAERAGYTTLEDDRKAKLAAYEKQLHRFQRLHENAEELVTALYDLESCVYVDNPNAPPEERTYALYGKVHEAAARARTLLRKIEGGAP